MREQRFRWVTMSCSGCGVERQTMSESDSPSSYVCDDCQIRWNGFREGIIEALGVALRVKERGGSLSEAIGELEKRLREANGEKP